MHSTDLKVKSSLLSPIVMTMLSFLLTISSGVTLSQDLSGSTAQYKLSAGLYSMKTPQGPSQIGQDLNLRATSNLGNAWIGYYETQSKDLRQTRLGWDNSFKMGAVKIQPSLQSATGGFVGGSLGVETGEAFFVGAGLGRTNLKNYVNLNFDPNDSWTFTTGYRWSSQRNLSLQVVHDNRENPDQQHIHLSYRTPFSDNNRFLIDVLIKSGTVENEYIKKVGLMTGLDWGDLGLRFAYDPKVNFTNTDMKRLIFSYRY
jgi:hypothetical protein